MSPRRAAGPARRALPTPPAPPTAATWLGDLWRLPARGTLARRLVVRLTIITTLLALSLGGIATVVAQRALMAQFDDRLAGLLIRQPWSEDGRGLLAGTDLADQPIGTAVVVLDDRQVTHGYLAPTGRIEGVPSNAALQTLSRVPADTRPVTRELEMLGPYRAASRMVDGSQVVIALPLAETRAGITALAWTSGGLTLLALALTTVTFRVVVVRGLRPVTDLATAARTVVATPLEHGHVDLSVRVPEPPPGHAGEVAEVSQAFNQMLGHVESALQARESSEGRVRRFVADVSHELRNPLAAIRGYAELTRRDRAGLPGQTGRAMDRIDAEAERMSGLVEDLLLLARLDADPTPATDPVDLGEVVVDAVSDARAAGPRHCWTLDVPSSPVMVTGDPHQLHQVAANLLANARTHTPPGTRVQARLVTDHRPAEGRACAILTVHDDGPGIPAAMVGRVFDRFARADTSRARLPDTTAGSMPSGSTGLGLSIVAAVVGAHGGEVSVESCCAADQAPDRTEPTWTTFTVRLPLAPCPVTRFGPGP